MSSKARMYLLTSSNEKAAVHQPTVKTQSRIIIRALEAEFPVCCKAVFIVTKIAHTCQVSSLNYSCEDPREGLCGSMKGRVLGVMIDHRRADIHTLQMSTV